MTDARHDSPFTRPYTMQEDTGLEPEWQQAADIFERISRPAGITALMLSAAVYGGLFAMTGCGAALVLLIVAIGLAGVVGRMS